MYNSILVCFLQTDVGHNVMYFFNLNKDYKNIPLGSKEELFL